MIAPAALPQKRVIALAIVRFFLTHVLHKMTCWRQAMMQGVRHPHRTWTIQVIAPGRTLLSPQSSEDRGLRLILGERNPRSHANHLPQHPGNHSAAFLNMSNHRPRWMTGQLKRSKAGGPVCRNPETPPNCPGSAQERPQAMTEIDIASDQEHAERGGTAATDLQLESEQRAMQILYDFKRQREPPEKLTGKRCRSPQYRSTVTCPENGRWRGLLSPTSKSTALSAHSSGGE